VKLVIQRVSEAEVRIEGESVGRIGRGFLVLVGAEKGDDERAAEEAARRVAGLRVFNDENGKLNLDLAAVGGAVLVVSQFTLGADLSRGRRPGFERALAGEEARPLYEKFVRALADRGVPVATGRFGAMMQVSLVNDGPATFILEVGSGLHASERR
jgi:D-tyrosyl-tRNA(Tyr) deacylase